MKHILALIICIMFISSGCSTPVPGRYYHPVVVPSIYKDNNNKLYFEYMAGQNEYAYPDRNISNKKLILYEFNENNKSWRKIATKKDNDIVVISKEHNLSQINRLFKNVLLSRSGDVLKHITRTQFVSYKNNIATIKDTNETIFTQILPTIDDIQNSINENFDNSEITYMPMVTGQYNWDQKSHLASICKDKYKGKYVDQCEDIVIFLLMKNDTNWNISRVVSYKEHFKPNKYESPPLYRTNLFDQSYYAIASTFDKKIGRCILVSYSTAYAAHKECFVKKDDNIKLKKLFGEIYPIEYKNMLDKIYEDNVGRAYNYTFDEDGNMHLFYNKKEDIVNDNYDYFWYGYFEKKNPTKPLYEQKIPWERE